MVSPRHFRRHERGMEQHLHARFFAHAVQHHFQIFFMETAARTRGEIRRQAIANFLIEPLRELGVGLRAI